MLHRVALLAVLAVLLLAAPRPAAAQAPAPAAPVDIRVNSERVWVDTMQQAGAAVNGYTSKDGQPPTPTNFNVVRVLGCGGCWGVGAMGMRPCLARECVTSGQAIGRLTHKPRLML